MIFKIGVLKDFAVCTGKHLCWSLFLMTFQVWRSATLLKRLQHKVFSCVYCEIFRNSFFIDHLCHLWWLLLKKSYWNPSQGFHILMNVYEFFKFSTLRSISHYSNTSWATHFHYIWPSWQGKKQFSTTYQN